MAGQGGAFVASFCSGFAWGTPSVYEIILICRRPLKQILKQILRVSLVRLGKLCTISRR